MDEIRNIAQDQTQAKYALDKYLELFSSQCNFFKFFIAPNGVLEWFGRSIKGNQKIHDFLRFEVCSQYDHLLFDAVDSCQPIECKSTHMETKQLPTEKDATSTNLNDSSFAGETTTDLLMSCDVETSVKDRRESITPPSSAKRFKHDSEQNNSFPPLLNVDDYFDQKEANLKSVPTHLVKSFFETPATKFIPAATCSKSSNTEYSDLKYLETNGILRSCTQPEHRSFRNSSSLNANGTWDRETKIQISYRIRLHDNDIQFALIIYTNLHSYSALSKRNLISEFDEVSHHKKQTVNKESTTRSQSASLQAKRKIGRRLRLL